MATIYVRSTDGDNASDGLSWANAKATIVGAAAVMAAGDRCWLSQVHAETQATAMTITSPGTAAAPCEFLCGNDAAEPPTALATTATISTTGASTITFGAGYTYIYGCTFKAGSTTNVAYIDFSTNSSKWAFETGGLTLNNTSASSQIRVGAGPITALVVLLVNVTVTFGNASQSMSLRAARITWQGGNVAGTAPTVLLTPLSSTSIAPGMHIASVDLNLLGSGTSLVNVAGVAPTRVYIENCKLGASVALTTGTNPGPVGAIVWLDNCDSADTNYRMQRHQYEGDIYSETTLIRTGGASDGTTGLSHKYVSSANSKFYAPLYGPEIVIWNSTVGSSQTVTLHIVHDSVTNLQDDEIWLETEYLGTSGFPLSLFADDRAASIIATPADQTASTETWTTTGLTNPNKQKLVTTQTPQEIGYYRCRVALAKASYTVYACPKLTVA